VFYLAGNNSPERPSNEVPSPSRPTPSGGAPGNPPDCIDWSHVYRVRKYEKFTIQNYEFEKK